ncbi:hypothetical protein DPMN_038348 [Dreissena polymorpha]|uniref:Uncharacterized protein n=1 Tax=Dreissena polymorpha TaxID=45954 RepID=A0A9D4RN37_DREPO|nr:hypothetical protein DPMN_038348 [Dreissena polymorpha]
MRYNPPQAMNRTQVSGIRSPEPKRHVVTKARLEQHPKREAENRHSHPQYCLRNSPDTWVRFNEKLQNPTVVG